MQGIDENRSDTELEKLRSRIRSSRIGCIVFSSIYFCAAIAFLYIYFVNKAVENLVISIVMLFLTGASIHGYRGRISAAVARERRLSEDRTQASGNQAAKETHDTGEST